MTDLQRLEKTLKEILDRLQKLENQTSKQGGTISASAAAANNIDLWNLPSIQIVDGFLRLKETVSGNWLDLGLQLFEDMAYPDEYNPFFHVAQGFWCQKDVFSQGFLGSASRIYIEFGGTYTPTIASDIGKLVYANGTDPEDVVGALVGYWNSETDYLHLPTSIDPSDPTSPTWWLVGYSPIASGSTITIPSGTGGGVTNADWATQPGGGAIQIGHGLNAVDDPPKIILSSSELGFDTLHIIDVGGDSANLRLKELQIGSDVNLYRESENVLATDDNLEVHNQYLNLDKSTAPLQFTLQVNNADKSRWLFDGSDVWLTAEDTALKLIAAAGYSVIVNDDLHVTGDLTVDGSSPGGIVEHGNEYHSPDFSAVGHAHAAGDVTSGVFGSALIPWTSIPASGIQIGGGDIYWQTATTPDVLETNVPWIFDSSVQIGAGLSVTSSLGVTGTSTLRNINPESNDTYGNGSGSYYWAGVVCNTLYYINLDQSPWDEHDDLKLVQGYRIKKNKEGKSVIDEKSLAFLMPDENRKMGLTGDEKEKFFDAGKFNSFVLGCLKQTANKFDENNELIDELHKEIEDVKNKLSLLEGR